ncbi:tripartite tricarboxylate transporter substrate binding protein [Falsiroseomonas sp.]|uniref:Bug family tripartite tricarboxylate transporter substrate binding protein n=1 Tax=Falsiroseomonas sp. TaxID=2870721 RepID=UPI00271B5FA9|nr:tripartite tricarboxylate transporter substrate-binding protein [Falsiroseomonas sp.]MDO9503337.1 tripartite tricarboxylate transporter substrate-binding protein [Falsiroseomonas sp.]
MRDFVKQPLLRRRILLAAPLAGLAAPAVRAQPAWPSQPIRIIVPYGPGGGTDLSIRILAPKLSAFLGQPIIIENRPGAGSTLGTDFVAKSPPDGSTFVHATLASTGIAAALYPRLPYDPVRDLAAVAPTVYVPLTLAVTQRGWNVSTAAELIETLRANPERYQYGSNGVGSTGHLANANFVTRIGARVLHVPYRSGSQTVAALLAGEIQFVQDIYGLLKPYHESGQVKCLFVTAEERSSLMPEVPTMREAGVPDYKAYSWFGLFTAAATPRPIVARMAAAVENALADPAIAARFVEMGTPGMPGWTPERFARYVAEEVVTWAPLVRASGATVE